MIMAVCNDPFCTYIYGWMDVPMYIIPISGDGCPLGVLTKERLINNSIVYLHISDVRVRESVMICMEAALIS